MANKGNKKPCVIDLSVPHSYKRLLFLRNRPKLTAQTRQVSQRYLPFATDRKRTGAGIKMAPNMDFVWL